MKNKKQIALVTLLSAVMVFSIFAMVGCAGDSKNIWIDIVALHSSKDPVKSVKDSEIKPIKIDEYGNGWFQAQCGSLQDVIKNVPICAEGTASEKHSYVTYNMGNEVNWIKFQLYDCDAKDAIDAIASYGKFGNPEYTTLSGEKFRSGLTKEPYDTIDVGYGTTEIAGSKYLWSINLRNHVTNAYATYNAWIILAPIEGSADVTELINSDKYAAFINSYTTPFTNSERKDLPGTDTGTETVLSLK